MRLLLIWCAFINVALGRTVAVLPLEPGATSEAFDGLGIAIAGLLVTDLAQVAEIQLVERAQLSTLLSEIQLGKTGYLDPRTAVQIGKGTGAEWVVIRSWSVVQEQFLMSVRTVDVASGKVIAAASSQGTTQDFVTVEKDLVEQLLAELQLPLSGATRRHILAQAPTENFDAISSYGAGLHAERQADYEAAREQFKKASHIDPSFDLPGQRLAALRSRLQQLHEQKKADRADERTKLLERGVAQAPDELSLSKPSTDDAFARLRIRWTFLNRLGKPCQAYSEMQHALLRHKGSLPNAPDARARVHEQAFQMGLYKTPAKRSSNGSTLPPRGYASDVLMDVAGTRITSFVVGIVDGIDRMPKMHGTSLAILGIQCAGLDPNARIGALVELRSLVRRLDLEDRIDDPKWGLTVGQSLELLELDARVAVEGMSARVSKRLDVLLSSGDSSSLRSKISKISSHAALTERHRQLMGSLSFAQIHAWVQAAQSSVAPVSFSTPACAPLARRTWDLTRFNEAVADGIVTTKEYSDVEDALITAQTLRLLGCIDGEPGPLNTTAKALAWVDSFDDRWLDAAPKKCSTWYPEMLQALERSRMPRADQPEHAAHAIVRAGLQRIVRRGCARF